MERQVDLNAISDGRLYGLEDMVRADCAGCAGCSACCMGMGKSVVLDPYDVYRLVNGTGMSFETLLQKHLELNVVDGVILPNLKMAGAQEACAFLNEEGRCSVHPYRPGICRIFPLGRLYENGSFQYILQVNECKKNNRTKVKIEKWLDIKDIKTYEKFVLRWHYYIKEKSLLIKESKDENLTRQINLEILNSFFVNDEIENLIN